MKTRPVYVLTIPLVGNMYASERRLAQTLLRRRADGPLLIQDDGQGEGTPFLQAVFSDREVLEGALEDLRTWATPLGCGTVRHERRRAWQADPPCSCILTEVRWDQQSWCNLPRYSQVETCQRHAPGLCAPDARPLLPTMRPPRAGLPLLMDEPPRIHVHSNATTALPDQFAPLLRDGRKVALYG